MLLSGDTLFFLHKTTQACSDQTSSIHPPSQCANSSNSHQMKGICIALLWNSDNNKAVLLGCYFDVQIVPGFSVPTILRKLEESG